MKILETVPWITKGIIALGIVFGVDWKKQVPITKREFPLALGAITFCAVADYLTNDYVWRQHEAEIVRLTGFKNGVYVSPERMKKMRQKVNLMDKLKEYDDEEIVFDSD